MSVSIEMQVKSSSTEWVLVVGCDKDSFVKSKFTEKRPIEPMIRPASTRETARIISVTASDSTGVGLIILKIF